MVVALAAHVSYSTLQQHIRSRVTFFRKRLLVQLTLILQLKHDPLQFPVLL